MSDNSQQIEYWNGKAGATWVAAQERLDRMLEPLSARAVAAAATQAGERVIDVGCGCGTTTLALAASGASVWGVDISAPMLALAKARAAGLDNVAFSEGDAATHHYTADHQLIFSRFGVMFFADPRSAFANMRTSLTGDGRMVFLCWQAPRENPWVSVGGMALQPFLPEPATPIDPRAPGPFAFADRDYLNGMLKDAGFVDIQIEDVRETVHVADSLDEAMAFQSEIGPAARALTELEGDQRDQALAAVRSALSERMTDSGLHLGAATWLVSARNQ